MTTKLCSFCGKEVPENAKICPYCNKALTDKVFTYTNDKSTNSGLDVSKFIKQEKTNSDNYFNSNIYSFSDSENEKRFAKKPAIYEEERDDSEEFVIQPKKTVNKKPVEKEYPKSRPIRNRRKQKNLLPVVCGILALILIIIIAIVSASSKDEKPEETTTTTQTTTTTTVATTTTTQATTTTTQPAIDPSSVDLDGYIGVDFSTVSADFGEQTGSPTIDEFYGGNVYYYDGMKVSTASSGNIASIDVDYTAVENKDRYRFKNVTYHSVFDHVVSELGKPDLDQMNDPNEPCIGYTLDIGSGLSIKFRFDDNKKVSGFNMFYAD